jgi:hypothetical protein
MCLAAMEELVAGRDLVGRAGFGRAVRNSRDGGREEAPPKSKLLITASGNVDDAWRWWDDGFARRVGM